MSEASTGVDAEMRPLTLAVWGVFQERSRACWDAPRRQTRRKERKTPENPTLFSLARFQETDTFFYVLNWPCRAVSSTGLPGADCSHIGQCSVPVLILRKIRVCFYWH